MSDRIRSLLHARADPSRIVNLQRFSKTGPGEYAEGNVFIGVTVPHSRSVCRECGEAALDEIGDLLEYAYTKSGIWPCCSSCAGSLRSAIEAFPEAERRGYLKGEI
jgi:hypothetical protein